MGSVITKTCHEAVSSVLKIGVEGAVVSALIVACSGVVLGIVSSTKKAFFWVSVASFVLSLPFWMIASALLQIIAIIPLIWG